MGVLRLIGSKPDPFAFLDGFRPIKIFDRRTGSPRSPSGSYYLLFSEPGSRAVLTALKARLTPSNGFAISRLADSPTDHRLYFESAAKGCAFYADGISARVWLSMIQFDKTPPTGFCVVMIIPGKPQAPWDSFLHLR
jgi:hypothetical protein